MLEQPNEPQGKIRERIAAAVAFAPSKQPMLCEFLAHQKLFRYYGAAAADTVDGRAKTYQELGIDLCWRQERRAAADRSWAQRCLGFLSRRRRIELLGAEEVRDEFSSFGVQQELFAPRTWLAYCAPGILQTMALALPGDEFRERLYAEPLEMERLCELAADNLRLRCGEFVRRNGGPVFFIDEPLAAGAELLFARHFLETCWARLMRNAIAPLLEAGVCVVLHSPGNIKPVLDTVLRAGVSGIHPVDSGAGMDALVLRKEYKQALCLFCCVDVTPYALSAAFIEQIAPRLTPLMDLAKQGGCFLGIAGGLRDDVPLQTVFSFYNYLHG